MDSSSRPRSAARSRNRRWWIWGLACAFTAICLVVFVRSFDWTLIAHDLVDARPTWVVLALLANFATLPLMTEQWIQLLPKGAAGRWRVVWECVTLAMTSMNTLPFGGGPAVAVGVISVRNIAPMDGAVSLLALEQVCEGFARAALLILALSTAPLPAALQRAMWISTLVVIVAFAVLVWLAQHPAKNAPAAGWRSRWAHHLEVLRRPRTFIWATLLSVAMKAFGLVAIYAVQRSLGVELPFAASVVVLAAVTFATSIAVSPGSVGVYELAAMAGYRVFGVPPSQAAALALILHVCFLAPVVIPGCWSMVAAALRNRVATQPE